jgi:hypothetical protein
MRKFFRERKLSILGTVVVGFAALFAPNINPEIEHKQTIMMFILFILFVLLLEIFYKGRNKK